MSPKCQYSSVEDYYGTMEREQREWLRGEWYGFAVVFLLLFVIFFFALTRHPLLITASFDELAGQRSWGD